MAGTQGNGTSLKEIQNRNVGVSGTQGNGTSLNETQNRNVITSGTQGNGTSPKGDTEQKCRNVRNTR